MNRLTQQEVFDQGIRGVITQGGFAFNNDFCVYLDTKTGRRCHVGLFMSDIEPIFYVGGYQTIYDNSENIRKWHDQTFDDEVTSEFLTDFQKVHDFSSEFANPWNNYRQRAQQFASKYGLNDEVTKEIPHE